MSKLQRAWKRETLKVVVIGGCLQYKLYDDEVNEWTEHILHHPTFLEMQSVDRDIAHIKTLVAGKLATRKEVDELPQLLEKQHLKILEIVQVAKDWYKEVVQPCIEEEIKATNEV